MMADLILKRDSIDVHGCQSTLLRDGHPWLYTMEHSYGAGDDWQAKVPAGTYECVLGDHTLHSGPIRTYEITGVPGHSGILFHKGNTEGDSEGCVLLGMLRGELNGEPAVLHSSVALSEFLRWADERPRFWLEVVQ